MLKEVNSRLLFNNLKAGVTIVEIITGAVIAIILSGITYNLFFGKVDQINNNSQSSQYYLSIGLFTEFLKQDLAMSKAVCSETNGLSLLVNPEGNLASITYTLKGSTIERSFKGKSKVFRFPRPNQSKTPLIFRIEEAN